jgi:hypothetical protein
MNERASSSRNGWAGTDCTPIEISSVCGKSNTSRRISVSILRVLRLSSISWSNCKNFERIGDLRWSFFLCYNSADFADEGEVLDLPLIVDAAAEAAPPMLTCLRLNDGYQFELLIRVPRDEEPITKVQIGPYLFREKYVPKKALVGLLTVGGPENGFMMHKSAPPRWSRLFWEILSDQPGSPTFLSWTGSLEPGRTGVFRFISMFPPGGLRAGLVLAQGNQIHNFGVNGPNYERFEKDHH